MTDRELTTEEIVGWLHGCADFHGWPKTESSQMLRAAADAIERLSQRNLELEEMGRAWRESDEHRNANALRDEVERLSRGCETCRHAFVGMAPAGRPHYQMCKRTKEDTGQGSFWFAKCETLGHRCGAWEGRDGE